MAQLSPISVVTALTRSRTAVKVFNMLFMLVISSTRFEFAGMPMRLAVRNVYAAETKSFVPELLGIDQSLLDNNVDDEGAAVVVGCQVSDMDCV